MSEKPCEVAYLAAGQRPVYWAPAKGFQVHEQVTPQAEPTFERQAFIREINRSQRQMTRIICVAVVLVMGVFAAWDARMLGVDHPRLAEFIVTRFVLGVPVAILTLAASFDRRHHLRMDWLMAATFAALCICVARIYLLFDEVGMQLAIEGMLLLLVAVYYVPGLFWFQKLLVGLLGMVAYFAFLWLSDRGLGAMVHAAVFLGMVNLFGTIHSAATDRQRRENFRNHRMLERLARTDQLTGADNRYRFDEEFGALLRKARVQELAVGLAIVDIDHFKLYNDHYGHIEGDACLTAVAQALLAMCEHPGDRCIRFGGEEFIMVKVGASVAALEHWPKAIVAGIQALGLPHATSATSEHISVSVGAVILAPGDSAGRAALMAQADALLYDAKKGGRNQARVAHYQGVPGVGPGRQ